MKRWLRISLFVLGIIVLTVAGGAAYINASGIPSYTNNAPDLELEYTPERIADGGRIVNMVCAECHRGKGGKLIGKKLLDIPKEFGDIHAPNITQDPTYGIGNYTDGEIAYLLRTGIKKDGSYAPLYMPKFAHMSEEDMYSVIAYLRSDAPAVQAAAVPNVPIKPSLLTKILCRVVLKPFPYPDAPLPAPDTSDAVALGKYIVHGKVPCYPCHSADFKTVNDLEPTRSEGYMAGGNKLLDLEGNTVYAPNITMDKATGIGKWTEDEFVKCLRQGIRPDGRMVQYPMLKLNALSDKEARAVYAYLQTLEPVVHEVPENNPG